MCLKRGEEEQERVGRMNRRARRDRLLLSAQRRRQIRAERPRPLRIEQLQSEALAEGDCLHKRSQLVLETVKRRDDRYLFHSQ